MNVLTRNISELPALKLVMSWQKKLPNIAADAVAFTKTTNKSIFEGTHLPMQDIILVKLKGFSIVLINVIVYFEQVYC